MNGNASHGHASYRNRSPTYQSWAAIIQRCNNPKSTSYPHYGARGITVCERWLKFENFLADMGERPEGTTIDREDGSGNYEPGNCRWATKEQQSANRTVNNGWGSTRFKRTTKAKS